VQGPAATSSGVGAQAAVHPGAPAGATFLLVGGVAAGIAAAWVPFYVIAFGEEGCCGHSANRRRNSSASSVLGCCRPGSMDGSLSFEGRGHLERVVLNKDFFRTCSYPLRYSGPII
jgi:hypothetical protein